MKTIGILGTGRMGVRLARSLASVGNHVVLGSRDPRRAERIVRGLASHNLFPGTYEDAARAPYVLPAIFLRDGLVETLGPLRKLLSGKVYVDITNPFNADYSDFTLPWETSGAEELQRSFPELRVVGAFKNVWWEVFDAPAFDGALSDVFVVSDDEAAKREVLDLVRGLPFRFLDAGRLANARFVERMTLFSRELGERYGYFPRMAYKLLGESWTPGQADQLGALISEP
jgi:hypothetical protein